MGIGCDGKTMLIIPGLCNDDGGGVVGKSFVNLCLCGTNATNQQEDQKNEEKIGQIKSWNKRKTSR